MIYDVLSLEIVLSPSPFSLGATLKGKNLLPWHWGDYCLRKEFVTQRNTSGLFFPWNQHLNLACFRVSAISENLGINIL